MQLHGYMKGLITQKNIEEAKKKAEKEKTDPHSHKTTRTSSDITEKTCQEKIFIF